jgi:PAS domain S-box-containing protein
MKNNLSIIPIEKELLSDIFNSLREPMAILDKELNVLFVNEPFYSFFKVTPEETIGKKIYELGNKQWNNPKLSELLNNILPKKSTFSNFELRHNFPKIGFKIMILNAREIIQKKGKQRLILLAFEDATDRIKLEDEIKNRKVELEKFYKLTVGRELKMIELKKKIEQLEKNSKVTK